LSSLLYLFPLHTVYKPCFDSGVTETQALITLFMSQARLHVYHAQKWIEDEDEIIVVSPLDSPGQASNLVQTRGVGPANQQISCTPPSEEGIVEAGGVVPGGKGGCAAAIEWSDAYLVPGVNPIGTWSGWKGEAGHSPVPTRWYTMIQDYPTSSLCANYCSDPPRPSDSSEGGASTAGSVDPLRECLFRRRATVTDAAMLCLLLALCVCMW